MIEIHCSDVNVLKDPRILVYTRIFFLNGQYQYLILFLCLVDQGSSFLSIERLNSHQRQENVYN